MVFTFMLIILKKAIPCYPEWLFLILSQPEIKAIWPFIDKG
jgi:hypothetical protein